MLTLNEGWSGYVREERRIRRRSDLPVTIIAYLILGALLLFVGWRLTLLRNAVGKAAAAQMEQMNQMIPYH